MSEEKTFEKILLAKRKWVSKWPKRTVFICSGGMDSTVTMAKLLEERKIELFPLFINRGQTNLKWERKSLKFFEKYFTLKYKPLFHSLMEININVPPKEIKHQLKEYSAKFGHPLRNTILQMVGVQYAISLSGNLNRKVASVFCAQIHDDPFPHSRLVSLRATTLDVCQSLDEWDWQITSPNIDPFLEEAKIGKEEIVRWAYQHKLPIEKTRSCYSNQKEHCGTCLSCKRRKVAFKKVGVTDKTKYLN